MASTTFTNLLGIKHPIIGGAMYPCSNPELVAAVSEAGGIGIVQPVSLVFVNRYNFRDGLKPYWLKPPDRGFFENLLKTQPRMA